LRPLAKKLAELKKRIEGHHEEITAIFEAIRRAENPRVVRYLAHGNGWIEVAETFSEGEFGPPKTRSSHRSIPIIGHIRQVLEAHRKRALRNGPEDLLFSTPKGTPLSPKNLYNRLLAPACDAIGEPRISWHSLRHTQATLAPEVGASLKTAQAILGHSDLETTLNTYMHAVPDSLRVAIERIGGLFTQLDQEVLFSDVPKSGGDEKAGRVN
jgi:integrase